MARTKSTSSRRHRKVLALAKGFRQTSRRRYRAAQEAVLHAGQYAYNGRRLRKRDMRSLWIMRLNAAVREEGMSYSKFVAALKAKNVELDRKVLAEIAVSDKETFKSLLASLQ